MSAAPVLRRKDMMTTLKPWISATAGAGSGPLSVYTANQGPLPAPLPDPLLELELDVDVESSVEADELLELVEDEVDLEYLLGIGAPRTPVRRKRVPKIVMKKLVDVVRMLNTVRYNDERKDTWWI
jgi:hypothetical protein